MKHTEAFERLVAEVMPHIKEVLARDVKSLLDSKSDFILVDVREDNEWQAGRIPGAVHIGRGVIERDVENIIENRDKQVVLYCGGGYRSALAAYNLQKMGYTNVLSMSGGIRQWRDLGYEECKD